MRAELPLLYMDENLRGLARWLRLLGFDVKVASPGARDKDLFAESRAEGRLLFTRDRALVREHGGRHVAEAKTKDQLRAVAGEVGWPEPARWFTRCVVCNHSLREIVPAERGAGAPGGFARYWRCDGCGRTYWRGSHYDRARVFLEAARG